MTIHNHQACVEEGGVRGSPQPHRSPPKSIKPCCLHLQSRSLSQCQRHWPPSSQRPPYVFPPRPPEGTQRHPNQAAFTFEAPSSLGGKGSAHLCHRGAPGANLRPAAPSHLPVTHSLCLSHTSFVVFFPHWLSDYSLRHIPPQGLCTDSLFLSHQCPHSPPGL